MGGRPVHSAVLCVYECTRQVCDCVKPVVHTNNVARDLAGAARTTEKGADVLEVCRYGWNNENAGKIIAYARVVALIVAFIVCDLITPYFRTGDGGLYVLAGLRNEGHGNAGIIRGIDRAVRVAVVGVRTGSGKCGIGERRIPRGSGKRISGVAVVAGRIVQHDVEVVEAVGLDELHAVRRFDTVHAVIIGIHIGEVFVHVPDEKPRAVEILIGTDGLTIFQEEVFAAVVRIDGQFIGGDTRLIFGRRDGHGKIINIREDLGFYPAETPARPGTHVCRGSLAVPVPAAHDGPVARTPGDFLASIIKIGQTQHVAEFMAEGAHGPDIPLGDIRKIHMHPFGYDKKIVYPGPVKSEIAFCIGRCAIVDILHIFRVQAGAECPELIIGPVSPSFHDENHTVHTAVRVCVVLTEIHARVDGLSDFHKCGLCAAGDAVGAVSTSLITVHIIIVVILRGGPVDDAADVSGEGKLPARDLMVIVGDTYRVCGWKRG